MMSEMGSMTAVHDASTAAVGNGAYTSLGALRDAHQSLQSGPQNYLPNIRSFLARARGTGAFLSDPKERKAAQGILDYWSAELASSAEATKDDFAPTLLLPFEPTQSIQQNEPPPASENKLDSKALIRWSAFAREWGTSNRDPGYLLTGDAIQQAARFRGYDHGIDELVTASENAEVDAKVAAGIAAANARTKRRNFWIYTALAICFTVVGQASVVYWIFVGLPLFSKSLIEEMKETPYVKVLQRNLGRLSWWQRLVPPYDFSGLRKLSGVAVPHLTLYAPNFSGIDFQKVKFPGAKLPSASSNDATT